jgi:hypothetical protein
MRRFIAILVSLGATACGSAGMSASGAGSNGDTSPVGSAGAVSYALAASPGAPQSVITDRELAVAIPSELMLTAGVGVDARAVLRFGGVDCYYNEVPAQSLMAFESCVGGYVAGQELSLNASSAIQLSIEYGAVTANVSVSGE